MNHTILIRIAKIAALLGFVLPWAAISCSGNEIATLNGIGLAIGRVELPDGQTQDIGLQYMIIIALLATIAGAVASFLIKDDKLLMRAILATSVAGIVCAFLGMMFLKEGMKREAAQNSGSASYERQMSAAAGAMIKIEERPGYFLTLLSLAAAAGLSGMALQGRQLPNVPALSGAMGSLMRRSEDDVADWDRIADKENPDYLQEYLLRHPGGRFAELARIKLQRLGIAPLERAAPVAPPPQPARALAVDAPTRSDPPPPPQEYTYEPAPEGPPRRAGLPAAAWAAIALVVIGVVGGGGYFAWRTMQAQQAAAAIDQAWGELNRDDAAALRAFIAGSPGTHREEAEIALRQLEQSRFAAAQAADSLESWQAFSAEFPGTQNAMLAQGRIGELQTLAAMTAPLVGPWTGAITKGDTQYEIAATLSVEGRTLRGSAQYPLLQCFGTWDGGEGSAARGSPWSLTETIQANSAACPSGLQVTLTLLPDGSLALAYFDATLGQIVASGSMTRQAMPAQATP